MNVIVTGPESSGTRFVSRWLEQHPDIVARHWSLPSGEGWLRHWPTDHGYGGEQPDALVLVMRNFEATCASQIARALVYDRLAAEANVTLALLRALSWAVARGVRVYPVLYTDLTTRPWTFDAVFQWLGCEPVAPPEGIEDGDLKWTS